MRSASLDYLIQVLEYVHSSNPIPIPCMSICFSRSSRTEVRSVLPSVVIWFWLQLCLLILVDSSFPGRVHVFAFLTSSPSVSLINLPLRRFPVLTYMWAKALKEGIIGFRAADLIEHWWWPHKPLIRVQDEGRNLTLGKKLWTTGGQLEMACSLECII